MLIKMKNYLLLLLFSTLMAKTTVYAQNDLELTKDLLNKTTVSIYKAQKSMIAGVAVKDPETLSLAVKNQVLAVEAINNNDLKLAVNYSLKARAYSNATLIKMKLTGVEYYLVNDAEKQLAEKYQYDPNKSADETVSSLKIIEEVILFDPQKLGTAYKISIN